MKTPLIIAHRGASGEAPENTLAAFALAQRQGADMLELDVRRSADDRLVVFHDATTERWNGCARPVQACSLAELQQLAIGGERVPTLEEVLDFAVTNHIALNIELKETGSATQCATLVRRFRLVEAVVVSSFYPQALHELRQVAPEIRRGYLMGVRSWRPDVRCREFWPFFALRAVAAHAWHPYEGLPSLEWVLPRVRRAGYAVHVWTVDDPLRMRVLADLGASGIITNYPERARLVGL
ncbi:MAG: glycerophosphodiester phosphodiesterase [Candidatus Viridilinea halotolerans]|uniref:Glycerophosphodiester phosphodiesterase n=1 Tax=Candidatus Viridilinea halotolerans TaxID=2491704 RepID=A0A426U418_9CHLR|nr:MAG: glycerophosphodiester phosphodiesterase [Candidatus Viridilinea halotolerans]